MRFREILSREPLLAATRLPVVADISLQYTETLYNIDSSVLHWVDIGKSFLRYTQDWIPT